MMIYHPKLDENGKKVTITRPSKPSPLEAWSDPSAVATVTPGGPMPVELNSIPFMPWTEAPNTDDAWSTVRGQFGAMFDEPVFTPTPGKHTAAGIVIEESDGRIWVVHPSNAFGGYQSTFPKGTVGHSGTLQSTAIKEAYEESGLQAEITGYLADSERSQSKTRYYLGRRVGGSPADMDWESQGVSLVPLAMLGEVLTHPNDAPLVMALQNEKRPARRDIIKYEFGLTSAYRKLSTVNGFRRKYGVWPQRLLMERGMADAIKAEILTPLGWAMMANKLQIIAIDKGTVIAQAEDRLHFEYAAHRASPPDEERADVWIWGVKLVA